MYFYAATPCSVAGEWRHYVSCVLTLRMSVCLSVVCVSVCLCEPNIVNLVYWKVYGGFSANLQHWCFIGQRWTHKILGSKGQISSQSKIIHAKKALWGWMLQYSTYFVEFRVLVRWSNSFDGLKVLNIEFGRTVKWNDLPMYWLFVHFHSSIELQLCKSTVKTSVVRYSRYISSIPVVGIVDTYVTIPLRYIVAVKNIVRRRKYREYRDTVELIPLGSECTQQACDAKTKSIRSQ